MLEEITFRNWMSYHDTCNYRRGAAMTSRTIGHDGNDVPKRDQHDGKYRYLDGDELIFGDEYLHFDTWIPTTAVGKCAVRGFHRRPVRDGVE